MRKVAPSEKLTSSARDWPCTVMSVGVNAPAFKPAIRYAPTLGTSCPRCPPRERSLAWGGPARRSYQHPLDAAVVGRFHIGRQPLVAEDLVGHLDHDVVGFQ